MVCLCNIGVLSIVSLGLLFAPPDFDFLFSVLGNRLAGKSISKTSYFVSSGILNLNSVNHSSINQRICSRTGERKPKDLTSWPSSYYYQNNICWKTENYIHCLLWQLLWSFWKSEMCNITKWLKHTHTLAASFCSTASWSMLIMFWERSTKDVRNLFIWLEFDFLHRRYFAEPTVSKHLA